MANDKPLEGQVTVVTGGGRGIGAAIARRLAGMGATAVICGRSGASLEATAEAIRGAGGRALAVECDVTQWPSVEALARRVDREFGRLDILVNNAGIGGFGRPLHEVPAEEWEHTMATNLRGVYYTLRAFAPAMIRAGRGHIINISSLASKNPLPGGAAYAASKWGLNGLSISVAEELRERGIRVSLICPGSTHTELSPQAGKDPARLLQPEDIAHVVAMLVTQAPQAFASEVQIRPTRKP